MMFDIILEEEEDGYWSVHCPALKGCHSQGSSKEEAIENIKEAIGLYLEVAHEKALTVSHSQSGISVIRIAV